MKGSDLQSRVVSLRPLRAAKVSVYTQYDYSDKLVKP